MSPGKRKAKEPKGLRIILYSIIAGMLLVIILILVPRNTPNSLVQSEKTIRSHEQNSLENPDISKSKESYQEESMSSPPYPDSQEEPPSQINDPSVTTQESWKNTNKKARLAIVFDDVGNSLEDLRPLLELPYKLTLAVLPGLAESRQASMAAHKAGKQVILHQPLESLGGQKMGPGGIDTNMAVWKIQALLSENLDSIEHEVGMNNHMGSKATAHMVTMDAIMEVLAFRNLFFLDSRTTKATLCRTSAARFQVPFLERSIFWDNETSQTALNKMWQKALEICRKTGKAVLIGHVQNSRELASVLKQVYNEEKNWLDLVFLSRL